MTALFAKDLAVSAIFDGVAIATMNRRMAVRHKDAKNFHVTVRRGADKLLTLTASVDEGDELFVAIFFSLSLRVTRYGDTIGDVYLTPFISHTCHSGTVKLQKKKK